MSSVFLKAKTISGTARLLYAIKHNRRQIPEKDGRRRRIDPDLAHLNAHLTGTAAASEVTAYARAWLEAAGVVPRKNAILCIEFVISLPTRHHTELRQFFADATAWLGRRYGGEGNILSADIHYDEAKRHLHVLVMPLINGKLSGSKALGGLADLFRLHQQFGDEVAAKYGLTMLAGRLSTKEKEYLAAAVIRRLHERHSPLLRDETWPSIRDAIHRDPVPFAHDIDMGEVAGQPPPKTAHSGASVPAAKKNGDDRSQDQPRRYRPPARSPKKSSLQPARSVAGKVAKSCTRQGILQPAP
ncbi:plasmid recombination protein [Paucibacter sp. DJ2R-2]|uniref:plasmid recombination protein n=1 Tax=Paucibacter sp. DJ2R-2 TaxID=2893558 RepID=UPI0021E37680|nr:plasmid recombination protein [Paucibacter sp. DJ2R-2]MCV2420290.1 plasmid recombination protein [Paucibacter sp. DJ4R-1]MCV2436765.1 plasmid recombination protein [Paucibacter sp. DJ2R-2]